MDKKLFSGLVKGIKEASKVKRGEKRPYRIFTEKNSPNIKNTTPKSSAPLPHPKPN